jgi:hypothetical protein
MTHAVLTFAHLVGLALIASGLVGVFLADLRTRQGVSLAVFAEAVRALVLCYDGLVVPGALLLLGSGSWMIADLYGWDFLDRPWLAGMVGLFAFEFIEGNTVTRLFFLRLRRATRAAVAAGVMTGEVAYLRDRNLPTVTHFLDLPLLTVIVWLGAARPETWAGVAAAGAAGVAVAALLSWGVPRLVRRGGD